MAEQTTHADLMASLRGLQTSVTHIQDDVKDLKEKQAELISWKDEMTGGRKLAMRALWIVGALAGIVGAVKVFFTGN